MTNLVIKPDKPYRNLDDSTINANLYVIRDGYQDEGKAIHKRAGLSLMTTLGSDASNDGIYAWDYYEVVIVVYNGSVYKITDKTGTFVEIGSGIMNVGVPVIFAEIYDVTNSELRLFMANGGSIYYTDGNVCTEVVGGSAPARCTHVAEIDTYLVCNDLDYPFLWRASEVENPTVINQAYSAQTNTDKITGIYVYSKRIYVTGKNSIDVYYDSGDTVPFRKIQGVLIEQGLASPYSVKITDDGVFYFTPKRDLMYMNGYTPVVLSGDYAKRIQEIGNTNDVQVDYINGLHGRKSLLVHFIDEDITLNYDLTTKSFSEFGYWNGIGYDNYIGIHSAYIHFWNINIIGSKQDGNIYLMSENYTTDNGNAIGFEFITNQYNHGTYLDKSSKKLLVDFSGGTLLLSFADDGSSVYGNEIQVSDPFEYITNLGSYKTRRYKVRMQDDSACVFNAMEETVDTVA
jgi:hypothetical protein